MNGIRAARRMRGYSILELMIALSIGLLVSLAAVQLFVTNQVNFQLQRGLGDVSENGRFALDFMGRQLRQGGYAPPVKTLEQWPAVVVSAADLPTGTAGLAVVVSQNNLPKLAPAATGLQGGIGPSDRLTIQYYSPNASTDCEGQNVPAGSYVVARFFLRADSVANTGSALACEGGYHDGTSTAVMQNFLTGNTGGVVILSALDNFQVLLGIGNAGADLSPQQYLTIAQYAALPTPRPDLVAVKLGLLVSSVEASGKLIGAAQSITVLDQTLDASTIYADNRVRRLYASTVTLRNVIPSIPE
ncbi:MAG: PilW family protein [Fluviicoccus sp.]|uniref:PilW family protein n=1 Tax=Fluviicoccus sp. TaxID=2003552 RepID=UPI002722A697|nr:PilW family protein [Fluviicoccus sp.]MDO8331475.1 PilW family protein [Fluviicoccus sp.]